jgi:guanylate kinase
MKGVFLLIVGASGSGKTTLITHCKEAHDLYFPCSYTTRLPREGEVSGEDYCFVTEGDFKKMISDDEFLEWAVYGGNFYGTRRSDILSALDEEKIIVKQAEVQGAYQLKDSLSSEQLKTVYIHAGPWSSLRMRIIGRGDVSADDLERRRERYEEENHFLEHADYVIENREGNIDEAKQKIDNIIKGFRLSE